MKKIRNLSILLTLLLIAGNIGYRLGQKGIIVSFSPDKKVVVDTSPPPIQDVDFSLFWEVWGRLEQKYIDKTKLEPQNMVYGAISGMVAALDDPYTVFLTPQENSDFKQDLNGSFEGIGAQLGAKDDRIVVIAPLKDHPAEKAGIKAGDWIIKVDGEETFGWSVPKAVNQIRGPKGTRTTLTIIHEGQTEQLEVEIIRDTIIVKSVELEWLRLDPDCPDINCPQIAKVRLTRFGDRTNDEWNDTVILIRQRLNQGEAISGLILDLRNNPGGYLQGAIYIASEFISSGVVVIQENSDGTQETYSVTRVGNLLNIPLVVLMNQGSASAAEILAGALRDYDRATLVGEKTFGKGSIQTPEDLPGGAGLHITTGKWKLPKGDWINGTGISPSIEVSDDLETIDLDEQLERAIEVFRAE